MKLFVGLTLFLVGLVNPSSAIDINLTPSNDSFVDISAPAVNYGTATDLEIDPRGGTLRTILIKFDLIPYMGLNASFANLSLYPYFIEAGIPHTICVAPVTSAWTELTVTWNNQPTYISCVDSHTVSSINTWYSWTILNLTQMWLNGILDNNGVYLFSAAGAWSAQFYSRNYVLDTTLRPYLNLRLSQPSISSSNTNPKKIFKCQASLISVNFSSTGVIFANASVTERNGTQYSYPMQNMGSGQFLLTYGNNNNTAWGNKSVGFEVGGFTIDNGDYIFVYSDECTGTNIQGYKNTSSRTEFGNYTTPLFTGDKNVLEVAEQPYLDYWGYAIFVLIMFGMMGILYIKTQGVAQPLLIAFLWVVAMVSSTLVPDEYKLYIMLLMATGIATIFWRLSKSA